MAIAEDTAVTMRLTNVPDGLVSLRVPVHPKQPSMGTRPFFLGNELLIEQVRFTLVSHVLLAMCVRVGFLQPREHRFVRCVSHAFRRWNTPKTCTNAHTLTTQTYVLNRAMRTPCKRAKRSR